MLPKATINVAKKWKPRDTRFQPYSRTAKKPDSRKNAKIPSAANADPKTSPTYREYTAQFVPNSNSITIPVATPKAKLMPKILVQNFVAAW